MLGVTVAALVAFLATFSIRRYARTLGLLDLPGERSSHRVVTPRGGGIAIMCGACAALAILAATGHVGSATWTLFSLAAVVGAVGVLDDRFGLPALSKFAAHIAAGCVVVWMAGPIANLPLPAPLNVPVSDPIVAWSLSLLWITAVVNFFNFMDGIDGLAAAQAIASCAGVVAAGWSADASLLALAVGGACLGFLFHNAPPARAFMGDSGSGFLGFVLATAPFLAPAPRRADAVLAAAIGLTLFLLDPLVTVVRRALQKKNIFRAHREHLYQQLVAPEEPAGLVTATYAAAAVLLALCGALGYRAPDMFWVGVVAGGAAFGTVWFLARQATRARSARRSSPL